MDGRTITVDPARVFGTRDRSWGMRGLSTHIPTNRAKFGGGAFWLWAPLYFDDLCTHLALHERPNGTRWLESALFVPLLERADAPTWGIGVDNSTEMVDFRFELDFYPQSRIIRSAVFDLVHPDGTKHRIDLETLYTFRMRGIGYSHRSGVTARSTASSRWATSRSSSTDFQEAGPEYLAPPERGRGAHGGSHRHRRVGAGPHWSPRTDRAHRLPRPARAVLR